MLFQHEPLFELLEHGDKQRVLLNVSRKSQADKIEDFHQHSVVLYETLKLRRSVADQPFRRFLSSHRTAVALRLFANILSLVINILVIIFSSITDSYVQSSLYFAIVALGSVDLLTCIASFISYMLLEFWVNVRTKEFNYEWSHRRDVDEPSLVCCCPEP